MLGSPPEAQEGHSWDGRKQWVPPWGEWALGPGKPKGGLPRALGGAQIKQPSAAQACFAPCAEGNKLTAVLFAAS